MEVIHIVIDTKHSAAADLTPYEMARYNLNLRRLLTGAFPSASVQHNVLEEYSANEGGFHYAISGEAAEDDTTSRMAELIQLALDDAISGAMENQQALYSWMR
jgi:hypothetical protein